MLSPPTSAREKNSRMNHEWENACLPFFGQRRQHSPGVHGERYENQLQDLRVDPLGVEITSQSHLQEKSHYIVNIIMTKPTLALPLHW